MWGIYKLESVPNVVLSIEADLHFGNFPMAYALYLKLANFIARKDLQ
jgi:hypothetical protein